MDELGETPDVYEGDEFHGKVSDQSKKKANPGPSYYEFVLQKQLEEEKIRVAALSEKEREKLRKDVEEEKRYEAKLRAKNEAKKIKQAKPPGRLRQIVNSIQNTVSKALNR